MQRGNPGTGEAETDGSRYRAHRAAARRGLHGRAVRHRRYWLNRAAFATPAPFTLGTLPRTLGDVRTPHRNNWDFVAAKDVRLKGSMRGEIKIEVLNITNTAEGARSRDPHRQRLVRSDPHAVGLHAPDAADVPTVASKRDLRSWVLGPEA